MSEEIKKNKSLFIGFGNNFGYLAHYFPDVIVPLTDSDKQISEELDIFHDVTLENLPHFIDMSNCEYIILAQNCDEKTYEYVSELIEVYHIKKYYVSKN